MDAPRREPRFAPRAGATSVVSRIAARWPLASCPRPPMDSPVDGGIESCRLCLTLSAGTCLHHKHDNSAQRVLDGKGRMEDTAVSDSEVTNPSPASSKVTRRSMRRIAGSESNERRRAQDARHTLTPAACPVHHTSEALTSKSEGDARLGLSGFSREDEGNTRCGSSVCGSCRSSLRRHSYDGAHASNAQ